MQLCITIKKKKTLNFAMRKKIIHKLQFECPRGKLVAYRSIVPLSYAR